MDTRPNPILLLGLAVLGLMLPRVANAPGLPAITGRAPAAPSAGAAPAGRSRATGPGELPSRDWIAALKRCGAGFIADRVMAEAAGVTFYGLLALFPALATLIALYGLFNDPDQIMRQIDALGGIVPGGGLEIIRGQVSALTASGHKALGLGALIGLATSVWSANAGVKAMFDALNVVYHEREKRGFVRLTLASLTFTLGGVVFLIVALLGIVVMPIVLDFVGLGSLTAVLVRFARWPVMLLLLSFMLSVLYRFGPSRNQARWQWVSWGGVAAAIGWVVISAAFSYYVANFGSYNKTYGSLGAVVGFMTWIWISSMVILMGAELNAELEHQTAADSTVGPDRPMGERGAFKADTRP